MAMRAEVVGVDEENEVRIPYIDHSPSHIADTRQRDRTRHDTRNTHLAFDQVRRIGCLDDMASTQAAVGTQGNVLPALTARKPRGNASCPISRKLSLAAVLIEKTQEEIAVGLPLEELNAIGPDAGVPCAKLTREFGVAALCQRLFNNQEIIAAGVCFDEGNHAVLIVPQRSVQ